MTSLAAILTMNTLKKSDNFKLIVLGLLKCLMIFILKIYLLALGQTNRIPLILAIWSPILL